MEGLRGFAVLLVFFAHYVAVMSPWIYENSWTHSVAGLLRNIGHAGVDLFFVMSGYLIYAALIKRERKFLEFFKGRILRIYPAFLVMFAIYVGLSLMFPHESKFPQHTETALIYTIQNLLLLPGVFPIESLIIVTWSLGYEMAYYVCMPLLISVVAMRKWAPRTRLLFFVGVSAIAFTWFYSNYGNGLVRMLMFISGVLVYEIQKQKLYRPKPGTAIYAFAAACGLMVLLKINGMPGWWRYLMLFFMFGYVCQEAFSGKGSTARMLSWAPLRWFGNMSYSYYLCHGLCLKATVFALGKIYPPTGGENFLFWGLMIPAFGITLIGSSALFLFVERPMSLFATQPNFGRHKVLLGIPNDGGLATIVWRSCVPVLAATRIMWRESVNALRLMAGKPAMQLDDSEEVEGFRRFTNFRLVCQALQPPHPVADARARVSSSPHDFLGRLTPSPAHHR